MDINKERGPRKDISLMILIIRIRTNERKQSPGDEEELHS